MIEFIGKDFSPQALVQQIATRLRQRGLSLTDGPARIDAESASATPEFFKYQLHALEENADTTRGVPLETHRSGAGRLAMYAKWTFRKCCQAFINEALSRQVIFNGHVRDGISQLLTEVSALRTEVEALRQPQSAQASANKTLPKTKRGTRK